MGSINSSTKGSVQTRDGRSAANRALFLSLGWSVSQSVSQSVQQPVRVRARSELQVRSGLTFEANHHSGGRVTDTFPLLRLPSSPLCLHSCSYERKVTVECMLPSPSKAQEKRCNNQARSSALDCNQNRKNGTRAHCRHPPWLH